MNRRQRSAHFATWLFLVAALIAIFVLAMLARRDISSAPPKLPAAPEQG